MPRLTAAIRFLADLFTGRGNTRKAVENINREMGEEKAAAVIQQITGKRPPAQPGPPKVATVGGEPPDRPDGAIEMMPVSSSNVHSIGYSEARLILRVRYLGQKGDGSRGGPGPLYEYRGVPKRVWEILRDAGSVGAAIWDKLRIRGSAFGHQFDYSLIGVGDDNNVPRKQTGLGLNPREIEQGGQRFRSNKPGTGRFS